jgi:hypothetical protein
MRKLLLEIVAAAIVATCLVFPIAAYLWGWL